MQTDSNYDIDRLNQLIETTLDSAEGYHDAAEANAASRFASVFRTRAAARRQIATRLQAEVRRLGGTAEEGGTVMGAAKRWFDNLKNSISGDEASVLSEVEAGEDHLKAAFEIAMHDQKLSVDTQTIIAAAYATIAADHDQLRDLKYNEQARKAS